MKLTERRATSPSLGRTMIPLGTKEVHEDVLAVIGEAPSHIPSEITGRHSAIPWRQMIDLRNFAVYAYWDLLPSIIWGTIQNDLPPLIEPLRNLTLEPQE